MVNYNYIMNEYLQMILNDLGFIHPNLKLYKSLHLYYSQIIEKMVQKKWDQLYDINFDENAFLEQFATQMRNMVKSLLFALDKIVSVDENEYFDALIENCIYLWIKKQKKTNKFEWKKIIKIISDLKIYCEDGKNQFIYKDKYTENDDMSSFGIKMFLGQMSNDEKENINNVFIKCLKVANDGKFVFVNSISFSETNEKFIHFSIFNEYNQKYGLKLMQNCNLKNWFKEYYYPRISLLYPDIEEPPKKKRRTS